MPVARATRPRLSNPKGLPVQKEGAQASKPQPHKKKKKMKGRLCGQGQERGVCPGGTEGVCRAAYWMDHRGLVYNPQSRNKAALNLGWEK